MKKFFLIATCILFAIPATYAQYSDDGMPENLPQGIQRIIDEFDELLNVYDEGITLRDIEVENNNIILTMELDEYELFGGMAFPEAFKAAGVSMKDFGEAIRKEMLSDAESCAALRRYKYNIIMRVVGNPSGQSRDILISYKDLK